MMEPKDDLRPDSAASAALRVDSDGGASDTHAKKTFASRRQRFAVGALALVSALVLGVSAWGLASSGVFGTGSADLLTTVVPAESDAGDEAAETDVPSDSAASADEAAGESSGASDAANADGIAGADSASAANGAATQSAAKGAETASAAGASGSSAQPQAQAGSSAPGSSGAASAPAAPQAPAPDAPGQNEAPAPATIRVSVSLTSAAVGNPVSAAGTYTFERGATAYDALCALGLSVNARQSPMGLYVAAIGGLAEKQHGSGSGWKYAVNGVDPQVSCAAYELHDGDTVAWRYVTSING